MIGIVLNIIPYFANLPLKFQRNCRLTPLLHFQMDSLGGRLSLQFTPQVQKTFFLGATTPESDVNLFDVCKGSEPLIHKKKYEINCIKKNLFLF
jgi:hypothetical protein